MRYVFVINPVAGKGKSEKILLPKIKEYFKDKNIDYSVRVTKEKSDTKRIAEEEASKGDEVTLFACGGEGTSFDIVNGIVGKENVRLGVFPTGSANDFLKFFGEENRENFLDIDEQINGKEVTMDLIKANEFYCLNGCSVGMDAMVARDMSIFKTWPLVTGSMSYNLAIVKNFFSKLGITAEITVDDNNLGKRNCLFAVVANGPVYGGGYIGAPDAVPFDNKLNFTLADVISRFKVPKFLKLYKDGNHRMLDYCTLKECTKMHFSADKPIPVNLDGEIILRKEMTFELVKNKLKFVLPRSVQIKNKNIVNMT